MARVLNLVLATALMLSSAYADQRIIVRALGGEVSLRTTCLLLGCTVLGGLDDPLSEVALVSIPNHTNLVGFISTLLRFPGILHVEPDATATLTDTRPPIPPGLYYSEMATFFGANTRRTYINQPATEIIRMAEAQTTFAIAGAGTVAVIDTGVDPNHPALRHILLPGFDYTRGGRASASEMGDVNQSTAAVVDGVPPTYVSASAAAVVDQSTAAVVDDPDHAAFGHGTMVAGIVHLVAPTALILPLKAFRPDGFGYTSDILRAVYNAVRENARVINMSFSMPTASWELKRAIDHATSRGAICVASAGNEGQAATVYPAAWSNVIGVASTDNYDVRSRFSNYGTNLVSLAAPGEAVITTYPYGTYAAAWGTSFSTPFVAGAVSLLLDARSDMTAVQAAAAISHAVPLGPELGNGRLDVVRAVNAARTAQ